jgi:glycine cleavage system aminomethyltransferase T
MDLRSNPFEAGLDWQVELHRTPFAGRAALIELAETAPMRRLVPVVFGGAALTWYLPDFWPTVVPEAARDTGYITSAAYSPAVGMNIGFAMLPRDWAQTGQAITVAHDSSGPVAGEVVDAPFITTDTAAGRVAPPI